MKHSLPLLALLAATVTTPLLAQDMSGFLNPRAMAAQFGLAGPSAAFAHAPHSTLRGADAAAMLDAITGVQAPGVVETASYIAVSPRPIMRPRLFDLSAGPVHTPAPADLIEEMVVAGPLGGNTAVVTGANTAVISGADTAIIRSSGATSATILAGDSPRPTFWQRLFGL
jgi:hypothetical protein